MVSFITFVGGVGVGAFAAVLFLALANAPDPTMTKAEFEQYQREWQELNDEYDVYSSMTVDELFGDLNDEEDE